MFQIICVEEVEKSGSYDLQRCEGWYNWLKRDFSFRLTSRHRRIYRVIGFLGLASSVPLIGGASGRIGSLLKINFPPGKLTPRQLEQIQDHILACTFCREFYLDVFLRPPIYEEATPEVTGDRELPAA